ncbi:hypothetical protein RclHR1_12150001 [Rhizophagus clarus]|uniref:Uncharacterized protein n=1 Tax=Rhizophagus clarus TaxID=94130 RepID=A0A2Z6QZA3_9GLOM|nr:hypothetical protein RclHR1_12150001 [Rhizophagus clarus]GES74085.1 hypothetical protein RCL_jg4482.t1 [Rhizophagus clarus]
MIQIRRNTESNGTFHASRNPRIMRITPSSLSLRGARIRQIRNSRRQNRPNRQNRQNQQIQISQTRQNQQIQISQTRQNQQLPQPPQPPSPPPTQNIINDFPNLIEGQDYDRIFPQTTHYFADIGGDIINGFI